MFVNVEDLLKKQRNMTIYDEGGWDMQVRAVSVEDIENTPAVDLDEFRPTAKWLPKSVHGIDTVFSCSKCTREVTVANSYYGTPPRFVSKAYPYCHCGAKMEDNHE